MADAPGCHVFCTWSGPLKLFNTSSPRYTKATYFYIFIFLSETPCIFSRGPWESPQAACHTWAVELALWINDVLRQWRWHLGYLRAIPKAVLYAGLLFWGCEQRFSCFQARLCPVKRGNRASSSRNEFDHSRKGTHTSFPLLDCRSCHNFGPAHFSIFF